VTERADTRLIVGTSLAHHARALGANRGAQRRWAPTAGDLGFAFAANVVVVAGLWWRDGGTAGLDSAAAVLTSGGRLTGLLGTYLVLVQLLLVARLPGLEWRFGLDRLTVWHRRNGRLCLGLLLAHAGLITAGYALAARVSLPAEALTLLTTFPGVLTATAGLLALVVVVIVSVRIVRRGLRYETWYFVHLYTYLGIGLSFSHQLATGRAFAADAVARGYWYALWGGTLAALLGFRVGAPLLSALRHRLRVETIVHEAAEVVTITVTGRRLHRLAVRPGQFLLWRFLTLDRWYEAHPFSLSAAPDGRRLRITVKAVGDYTGRLLGLRAGTRVIAEGPYGAFTDDRRTRPNVLYIAGGIGITPIRAMLETTPAGDGEVTLFYRAVAADELLFRDELDELARRRGIDVRYLLGDHRDPAARHLLGAAHLRRLLPDVARRDVFVCGPPAMTATTERSLRAAGVPRRQIHTERFAF
jgi:predicted ferric reductase